MKKKILRSLAAFAVAFSLIGAPLFASATVGETPVQVTIQKYIDGTMATALSANSQDFPMLATYTIGGTPGGPSPYALSASGYNGDPTPYQALTSGLTEGDDFATNEDTSGPVVGADCSMTPFSLVGYTSGNTLEEAQTATPTMVAPAFTGLTSDKYVIVWNHDCAAPTPPETVTVTIDKYVDGVQATAVNANSSSFPMSATWNAENIGSGTGTYDLSPAGNNSPNPYEAMTVDMTAGADYATNEVTDGEVVSMSCSNDTPFVLVGYTWGNTPEAAAAQTPGPTSPSFTDMTQNKYVIVWNHDCSVSEGDLEGTVTGGNSPHGTLAVTSITQEDTNGTADNTYENGWSYTFNITVPDNESNLSMKFANWTSPAPGTIPAGGNMQISSLQADNGNAAVPIAAANTYSTPPLHMTGDLDLVTPGLQVQVKVQVKIPVATVNGAYSTSYGVQTLP